MSLQMNQEIRETVNGTFSENALKMMRKRYLLERDDGTQETPADLYARVAETLANVERSYGKGDDEVRAIAGEFFDIMARKEYTPAGRTLTNAGTETPVIANCVVLPIHDSMESIFQTLKDAALLQQAGCGLGFDFSELRPADFPTKKSRGRASGPVSFLKVYDAAFGTIKQQCFAKGTRIVTKRGLIPIEEVWKGDETYTEKGWKKVTEVFSNGVRDTLKLVLDSGFEIELTPEHRVAVVENGAIALKRAKDVSKEDVLLMKLGGEDSGASMVSLEGVDYAKSKYTSFQLQPIRQPEVLDERLAYILGLYYADGWNGKQGIGFCIPDDDSIEQKTRALVHDLFGVRTSVSKDEHDNCRKVKVNSLWVKRYLEGNGMLKQHAHEIRIPEKILRSPAFSQMAFVAGFFDGDGDNGRNYRLNTSSKTFAQQLQLVLVANGIGAKIKQERRRANWRMLYRVGIIGKDSTHRFYEKLSHRSWKIEEKKETKDFGWIFPFHPVRDLGYSWTDIKRLHDGVRSTVSSSLLAQIQQRAILAQAEAAASRKIDWTGFLPVRVRSMEKAGRQEVYDFEVEDVHMINAGLYTSNSRHGANMAMMRVDHPDILDYIDCKKREGDIRNFNITVTVTDEFMKAVREDPNQPWMCTFKGKKISPRRVVRHPNGSVASAEETHVTVGEIFQKLVDAAWNNGEPGIAFIDNVNRTNPLPGLGPIATSNPCGEQFLHPYDNCNLGSINLAVFVQDGELDWNRLRSVTRTSVRMMDNVIDVFDFPVQAVNDTARANRRIGLGIMGFADMLFQLKVPYNSEEGIAIGEKVMGFIQEEAHQMSRELAEEKGAFPNYDKSVYASRGVKMRNTALTTVAPTGSISMSFDASSGLEPVFALAYIKQDKDGNQYRYMNQYLWDALEHLGISDEDKERIKEEIIEKGSIQHLTDLPEDLRATFVSAMDIPGRGHMAMQAAFQRHVDNSISKTINFKNEATKEDIAESFFSGWNAGCKSLTVYRDGSRVIQVLNVGKGDNIKAPTETISEEEVRRHREQAHASAPEHVPQGPAPRPRPEVMSGKTYRVKTGYGKLYITVNDDEKGHPFEVFATIGKSGGYFQEQSEAICRLISLAFRSRVPVEEVVDHLKGIRGPMPVFTDKGTVLSLPDAIGRVLEEHMTGAKDMEDLLQAPENQEALPFSQEGRSIADFGFMPGCPDCGSPLVMAEGCVSCKDCGFSRCT